MRAHTLQNFSSVFKYSFVTQLLSYFSRNYSDLVSDTSHFIKLFEKSFTVSPGFGKLLLNSKCNCVIQPTNLQDYPDANYASVTLWGGKNNETVDIEAELHGQNDFLKLDVPDITEAFCDIYLPIKYDVEAYLENGSSIHIQKLENDYIEVSTNGGSITTKDLKSSEVLLATDCGPITANGVLKGNVHITAKRTILRAQRLQGSEFSIQAGNLQTEIESLYMRKGSICADSGQINMKHLHGSTKLHLQTGRISLVGLSGSLQAVVDQGEADIQVSEVVKDSLIQVNKGMVCISLSDASNTNLDVSSPSVEASHDIKMRGAFSVEKGVMRFRSTSKSPPLLRVHVKEGCVKLATMDWFSSLGIKSHTSPLTFQ